MKKIIKILIFAGLGYCIIVCGLYFFQEYALFQFSKLDKNHVYQFPQKHETIQFKTDTPNVLIEAVYFPVSNDTPKGAVLFFHGNGGTIQGWGNEAKHFLKHNYEVLFLEYRQYGKSGGKIQSESQLVDDAQIAYDYLRERFDESQIIISGTSMGTGVASALAIRNNPKMLFMNAPYYGLNDLIHQKTFVLPEFVIRYKFESFKNVQMLNCPIEYFHGTKDRLIPISHSQRLLALSQQGHLTKCVGLGHNNFSNSHEYSKRLEEILK